MTRFGNHRRSLRAGLAPLELVLSLPLLLMVMGLMIYFGNATYWKLRASNVARQAAWSQRWPRTGQDELTPRYWPAAENLQSRDDEAYADLDPNAMRYPVVRGPLPDGYVVRDELLDFSRGSEKGAAEIERSPAALPKLGEFRFDLEHPILDDKFQYPQMGLPGNVFRRIPRIYELPKADASLSAAFGQAVSATVNSPSQRDLRILDRDEELQAHFGQYIDFHPRLGGFCSTDVQAVNDDQVQDLIDRIDRLPHTMAGTFLGMYQQQLAAIDSQIADLQSQGGSAAQIAGLEAQRGPLQTKIDQLQQFRASLR